MLIKEAAYLEMRIYMFNLEDELKKLPDKPGVYIMHDKQDTIIYVGKAKVLKTV